jgi:hypothetical protein
MKHQRGGSSMKNSDEGMGLSVVVYAIAMMCGLALFVLPVVWANSARVYDNPGVTANLPGGPVRADNRANYPLAALHSPQIVSPAMLAELNAKATKEKPTRHASTKPAPRLYAQVEQRDDAEPTRRRGLFFFSWF